MALQYISYGMTYPHQSIPPSTSHCSLIDHIYHMIPPLGIRFSGTIRSPCLPWPTNHSVKYKKMFRECTSELRWMYPANFCTSNLNFITLELYISIWWNAMKDVNMSVQHNFALPKRVCIYNTMLRYGQKAATHAWLGSIFCPYHTLNMASLMLIPSWPPTFGHH